MQRNTLSVLIVSVAIAAAVWAGFFLARRPLRVESPATEAQFVRRLRAADPHTPRWYYRESQTPGLSEAVIVSTRPLTADELAELTKSGEPDARWDGVFRIEVETNVVGALPEDGGGYRRVGPFVFYGDEQEIGTACRLVGLD